MAATRLFLSVKPVYKGVFLFMSLVAAFATFLPRETQAGYRGRGNGAGIAAGIIGGLAVGAILAGSSRPTYASPVYNGYYDDGYYPVPQQPVYPRWRTRYVAAYDDAEVCYYQRRKIRTYHGYVVRRVQICE